MYDLLWWHTTIIYRKKKSVFLIFIVHFKAQQLLATVSRLMVEVTWFRVFRVLKSQTSCKYFSLNKHEFTP